MIVKNLVKSMSQTIRLPAQFHSMIMLEETEHLSGKYSTFEYSKAPYALVRDVAPKDIISSLKTYKYIPLKNEHCLYAIYGKDVNLELNMQNMEAIEMALEKNLNFYLIRENQREERSIYHKVRKSKSAFNDVNILIERRQSLIDGSRISRMCLLTIPVSKKDTFICNDCFGGFSRSDNRNRHTNSDTRCQTEPIILAKQKCYGKEIDTAKELYEAGYIDVEHLNFTQRNMASYDIETLETVQDNDTRQQAILKLLSISIMSTFDDTPTCIVRHDDTNESSANVVEQFLRILEEKAKQFNETVPSKFRESLESIRTIEKERREEHKRLKNEGIKSELVLFPAEWKVWLRSKMTFKVFAFNGQRFDTKVLAPMLFNAKLCDQEMTCGRKKGNGVKILKRGSAYFSFNYNFEGGIIEFVDICNYLSPCNLSGFLKMANISETKSVFPYQHFNSVEELKSCKTFPAYECFWSDLKNDYSCTKEEYMVAKELFEERRHLPNDHPDKMDSMLSWLIYYNNLDTKPLLEAIRIWFDGFQDIFDIDPQQYASLPSMSQRAMFKNYDRYSPYLYSLPRWKNDVRQDVRDNIVGGLCTNPHRMCDLRQGSNTPHSAKFTPNGSRFTSLLAYDFNSLYPWALKEEMPCSPGIHWKLSKNGLFFIKNQMLHDSSLAEIQFLLYLQHNDDRFRLANGDPCTMEHSYFRGQVTVDGLFVDGFASCNGINYVIEYNGCYHHTPCPHNGCKFNEKYDVTNVQSYAWYQKQNRLKSWCDKNNGQLIVQWECQFDIRRVKEMETKYLPRILRKFERNDDRHITNLVETNQLFGYVKADISASDEVINKYRHLNFPPVTRRATISPDMLSDYMKDRLEDCNRKANVETVVNAWNGKQLLIYTPLLKFYLSLGLNISNVTSIIQYVPSQCFSSFIDKCVSGRIAATGVSDTKANTFKVKLKKIYMYSTKFRLP